MYHIILLIKVLAYVHSLGKSDPNLKCSFVTQIKFFDDRVKKDKSVLFYLSLTCIVFLYVAQKYISHLYQSDCSLNCHVNVAFHPTITLRWGVYGTIQIPISISLNLGTPQKISYKTLLVTLSFLNFLDLSCLGWLRIYRNVWY